MKKWVMIDQRINAIRNFIDFNVGAKVGVELDSNGFRNGLTLWFEDLGRTRGPLIYLGPTGLKRHEVILRFADYSKPVVEEISAAAEEKLVTARALFQTITGDEVSATFPEKMDAENWLIDSAKFELRFERRNIDQPLSEYELEKTSNEIVLPLMGALAELIGYEEIAETSDEDDALYEGAVKISNIRVRERNPRNRLLCLRLHGERCQICGFMPEERYGAAGNIIEVHHLQPLSSNDTSRPYSPKDDLIPLCPNCHRAVHSRSPVPYTPGEISDLMNDG
ncbi:MAG: HNH endonuclease [Litorivicinaceae bacterium]|nr:HNH endonuclease [Litorivicinaceae bacterium]